MNAQAGMLVLMLKQVNEEPRFSKSVMNAFQFQSSKQELVTVLAQSAVVL